MSILLDKKMTNSLMVIASNILHEHFFYDKESLEGFKKSFAANINYEHIVLQHYANDEFKHIIWGDPLKKLEFTAHFVGYHLCKTLYDKLNFTDPEIDLFEDILVKYIKVCEPNDLKQSGERTTD